MKWTMPVPEIYQGHHNTIRSYRVYDRLPRKGWYFLDVFESKKITGISNKLRSWLPVKCHYSGKWFLRRNGVWLGATIPQAKVRYLCHPKYGKAARKESKRLFDASERNCNTCKYLVRTPFKADSSGLQSGVCSSESFDYQHHPYWKGGYLISFAPDDYMGMSCWTERKKDN